MIVEKYFEEWWTPKELPQSGFNKTAMYILKIKNGNVILYNSSDQIYRTYYNRGNATRADWYDKQNESVQIQLNNGDVVVVNRGCQIVRKFNR